MDERRVGNDDMCILRVFESVGERDDNVKEEIMYAFWTDESLGESNGNV